MASRTCSELQRLVQALSTSCCLVSNFEIWCARGLEFTHGPRPAKPPAAMQQPAHPAQLACGQPLGLPKGPPAGTAPFSKGGAATAAGNWGNKWDPRFADFWRKAPQVPNRGPPLRSKWRSRPISRVLSWTVIPLGATSPLRSSSLPGPDAGHVMRSLFGLAPGGVCRAGLLPGSRCALTAPFHPYLCPCGPSAVSFCCTFRRLAPPRRYLAPCPVEPGLSSAPTSTEMDADDATVWPTPPWVLLHGGSRSLLTRRYREYRRTAPCATRH
jgi:hypothetical protein